MAKECRSEFARLDAARRRGIEVVLITAIVVVASLIAGSSAGASTQSPTFTRADHPFIGNSHTVGDFNGDGKLDIAGTGSLDFTGPAGDLPAAIIKMNNGSGTFGGPARYPIADWAQDIVAADFNRDGKLDLALTINNPQIGVSLLIGNGDGSFRAPVNFPNTDVADSPAIDAVDLNNDAKLDLVIAHEIACYTAPCIVSLNITVMMGNGDGTFQPAREIEVGRGMTEIAVGDFNRDGFKDLAISGDNARVYRLFGNGDGTFVQQPTLTLTADTFGVDGTDIDVADFNGDSIQDLVVAVALNGSRTAVLIGNGDGTFRAPLIITEPNINIPHQQDVADFNGDGFQDLALSLADGNTGLIEILNGNGDGTFQPRVLYVPPPPISVGGYHIVAGDFNGDNKPDISLGRSGAFPAFLVLLNSTGVAPPPPPATPSAPTLTSPAQDATPAQPIAFDWTDVSAAASYRIQIDDSSNLSSPFVVDQTLTASQFSAATLAVRQHWWRVRAINSAGTAGAWSSVRRFTPQAIASAAALSALSVSPSSVAGGASSQGTLTLTSAAPAGGFAVSLSSGNPAAVTVPASASVAQGATTTTFGISTSAVTASTPVTITAGAGGVTRTASLTVTPPGPPAQTATLTVSATGRSGSRVTSSPAGINVSVGSSGSASFTTGSSITLSVSNGRDAVWSGACSSGGSKRRTCTFTLGANSTVTANVK